LDRLYYNLALTEVFMEVPREYTDNDDLVNGKTNRSYWISESSAIEKELLKAEKQCT